MRDPKGRFTTRAKEDKRRSEALRLAARFNLENDARDHLLLTKYGPYCLDRGHRCGPLAFLAFDYTDAELQAICNDAPGYTLAEVEARHDAICSEPPATSSLLRQGFGSSC